MGKTISVVIPYVNEYPQILFTLQSLVCELREIDHEIIAIDNGSTDRGGERVPELAKLHPRMTATRYGDRLSHWQAKNYGIRHATGDVLFFLDGHCLIEPGSLRAMLEAYSGEGTFHLPIRYMLDREGADLIYKPVEDQEKGIFHYQFTRMPPATEPFEVEVMSSCGMMIARDRMEAIGRWPTALGIYGGGENFICGTMRVLGWPMRIFPRPAVYHYAEKRGYSWTYDDWLRNRCIGAYVPFGEEFASRFMASASGRFEVKHQMLQDVVRRCLDQHLKIQLLKD